MCGIAGILQRKQKMRLEESVKKMLSTIVHRGPDAEGIFVNSSNTVALGHRRLSIIDLSQNGKQPMEYRGRYHVTFNGEIYNYLEIREELQKAGHEFRTETDTEVLLAAYSEWGPKCVDHFNGMWSFAVYDEEKKSLFCSRDRFGVKPFYYCLGDDFFVFGSEIKELLEVIPGPIKADKEHLSAYLTMGALDYDGGTLFKDVKQLPGGFNFIIDCDTLEIRQERYFDLRDVQCNDHTSSENEELFKEKFLDSVRLRLRSDVSVGSCLSGGLDSSAIVCAVREQRKNGNNSDNVGQVAVSSCFEDKRYDEQEYIDEVVKKTGVKGYKVFPDMGNLFSVLDKIIWHMDEPFGSTSIYAQWNVFEEAKRRGLTVMLDGQGSDEQLAGYTPFYNVLFIDLIKKGKWKTLIREINAYRKGRSLSEPAPFYELILSLGASCLLPASLWYKALLFYVKRISGLPFPNWMYKGQLQKKLYRAFNKRNAQQYIYAGMTMGLPALLHYEDRDSMAHSIEARVPFLDYKLAEFIYSVPIEHKVANGRTKVLIREGLKDILPKAIYDRISKLGFVTPEDKWLKENEEFFYNELENACDRLKDIIDKKKVLDWYKKHVRTTRMGDSTCFRIICCARWANVFNVSFAN